jgi:hypothetical protein
MCRLEPSVIVVKIKKKEVGMHPVSWPSGPGKKFHASALYV